MAQKEETADTPGFVALMRRYVVDYTNSHDTSVCAEIMEPGYTLHMGDDVLCGRDELYVPAAVRQFRQFPGLCLTVHEIVTNGDRLALRFSEHGASRTHAGAVASWAGIGVYRWNGERLVENYVEQDYLARRRQLKSGRPTVVEPPAIAPWDTRAVPSDADAEATAAKWLHACVSAGEVRENDGSAGPRLDGVTVTVDDIFSAGSAVAFRATLRGTYAGGLTELSDRHAGAAATLHATGIVHVAEGEVRSGHVVTDRLALVRAVTSATERPNG
ncbi:ester cyclase [Amycolatopsis sp. K13G38]|uniref:Ester cyclase n=1 Tax=Amycolatopsis acididurans TaxID=2724524 RepID=A0ABX1JE25_9PSEU|nr:ester cyclase [Amycolatopsis acididurans]NKQ58037.1 ester cyclase [Amycolatopsis acididurans]